MSVYMCMCVTACVSICPPGGVILAVIEGVGIAINRAVSEQYKPGVKWVYYCDDLYQLVECGLIVFLLCL